MSLKPFLNLSQNQILPKFPTTGSFSLQNLLILEDGGGAPKLLGQQGSVGCISIEVLWKKININLAELAKLRRVDKMKLEDSANHLGIGRTTVIVALRKTRA